MATFFEESRKGQSPTVRGLGGGSIGIDWQQQPSGFSQASAALETIMSTLEQEEIKRQKKETEKFDMYKTLREAGYETKAAHAAVLGGAKFPTQPPDETTKEKKEKLELEGIAAETELKKEKSAAYARGDIGRRRSAADKMNAAQLQREIKRLSDPFENPDYDSEESASYKSYLNQRLQQLSQYKGAETETSPLETISKPSASEEKVLMRRPDGAVVKVKKQDVTKAEQKGYVRNA